MEYLDIWFSKEVQRWRTGASVVWSLLLLPPVMFAFLTLGHVDLLSPHTWIWNSLRVVLYPYNWTFIVTIGLVLVFILLWDAKYYSVRPQVLSTRIAYIWNIISPQRLVFIAGHTFAAAVITWAYTALLGQRFSGLVRKCPHDRELASVNEYHTFLVVHGMLVGGMLAVHFLLYNAGLLTFPIVQQSKFFQVKSALLPLLMTSGKQILLQLRYYYLLYYLFLGSVTKPYIAKSLGINIRSEDAVDTLTGMLDLGLFWQALVSGTMVCFLFNVGGLLYRVYHTEPYQFEIDTELETDRFRTLGKALGLVQYPMIQYLAFQDLHLLSQQRSPRRSQLFLLSQPGGHPHNWNSVSSECLHTLNSLTQAVMETNNRAFSTGPTRQLSGEVPPPLTAHKGVAPVMSVTSPGPGSAPGTPVANLSYRGAPVTPAQDINARLGVPVQKPPSPGLLAKIGEHLKKRKAVAFFLSDLPDAASKRLFADIQMHISAVEGISFLAAASYEDDTYGVVQKSLPEILTTLLTLQEAVEKHLKLAPPSSGRKTSRASQASSDVALRFALRSALKSAIYRIVETFGIHLKNVSLSVEHSRRLKQFMEYKE